MPRRPSQSAEQLLAQLLTARADVSQDLAQQAGWRYSSVEDLVLRKGTWFDPPAETDFVEMNTFTGPADFAHQVPSYAYVEGFVLGAQTQQARPVAAAWCVDRDSRLLAGPVSAAYVGVALTRQFRLLMRRRAHTAAALHNQEHDRFRLLQTGLPSSAIVTDRGRPSPR